MATTDERGRKLSTPPSVSVHHVNFASDDPLTSSPVTYSAPGPSPFSDRFAAREHVHVEGDNHQKQSSLSSSLPLPRISNPFESSGMSLPSTASELSDILALIDEMKLEPEWRAARYHLLLKNCNSFTSELCYRLTGRKAPAWINRAAWLAQSLPCLGEGQLRYPGQA